MMDTAQCSDLCLLYNPVHEVYLFFRSAAAHKSRITFFFTLLYKVFSHQYLLNEFT